MPPSPRNFSFLQVLRCRGCAEKASGSWIAHCQHKNIHQTSSLGPNIPTICHFLVEKRFLVYLVLKNNDELRWHHASFRRTTLSCLPFVHSYIFPFQILITDKVSPDKNTFQTSSQGASTTSSSGSGSPMDVPAGTTTKHTATNNAMVVNWSR